MHVSGFAFFPTFIIYSLKETMNALKLVGAISEKLLSISTSGCTSRATAEGGE